MTKQDELWLAEGNLSSALQGERLTTRKRGAKTLKQRQEKLVEDPQSTTPWTLMRCAESDQLQSVGSGDEVPSIQQ